MNADDIEKKGKKKSAKVTLSWLPPSTVGIARPWAEGAPCDCSSFGTEPKHRYVQLRRQEPNDQTADLTSIAHGITTIHHTALGIGQGMLTVHPDDFPGSVAELDKYR
ncbi:hypothetical protein S7711_11215 [Stachybotrys chartarum IBT 7711]|uniref:Uncharacterized protein n=1 Tax=Stachybotrys chartarum (strain CBS 109288 / IBT 7711) TaxID=1280523 RepID=A0A084B237_STACB|nr:hypothetical protein S7711_11215 [Stachybotrys chartarum IBT 7711]